MSVTPAILTPDQGSLHIWTAPGYPAQPGSTQLILDMGKRPRQLVMHVSRESGQITATAMAIPTSKSGVFEREGFAAHFFLFEIIRECNTFEEMLKTLENHPISKGILLIHGEDMMRLSPEFGSQDLHMIASEMMGLKLQQAWLSSLPSTPVSGTREQLLVIAPREAFCQLFGIDLQDFTSEEIAIEVDVHTHGNGAQRFLDPLKFFGISSELSLDVAKGTLKGVTPARTLEGAPAAHSIAALKGLLKVRCNTDIGLGEEKALRSAIAAT